MLIGIQPKILEFKACKKSDLIKLSIKDKTRLCMCGLRHNNFWNILVLDDPIGPHLINVIGAYGIEGEFEDKTAISYGSEYRIEIVPTSAADIEGGHLLSTPGCLTIHKDEVAINYRMTNNEVGAFNPVSGEHHGHRGYSTAAFGNWRILLQIRDEWVPIYEFRSSSNKTNTADA